MPKPEELLEQIVQGSVAVTARAVAAAAPDASGVTFDLVAAAAELPLLQITRRPAAAR